MRCLLDFGVILTLSFPSLYFLPFLSCRQGDAILPGCHSCSVCAQGACREGGETGVTCDCPPGRSGALCDQTTAPNPCQNSRSAEETSPVKHPHASAPSNPSPLTCLLSFRHLAPGAFRVCACRRVRPTAAGAVKATRVSTAIDGRSLRPAGGSAADTGSVACQRQESPSATVSHGTPDLPVTQVKWRTLEEESGEQ